MPLSAALVVVLLALAGLGLGMFVPANNAAIMQAAGAGSAATLGGLVNMARGIGTTFGIALVTLALHVAGPGGPATRGATPGSRLGFGVLAVAGVAAVATALASRPTGGTVPPEEGIPGAFS